MSLTLDESAAMVGGHCWIERRLFEVLGAWGAAAGAAGVVAMLDRHSQHAAWRAAQWWDRLPVLAGVDREALVTAPAGWEVLLGLAGGHLQAPDGDAALLAVAHRVALPRLVARYRGHRGQATAVADGPVIRTLAQVAHDARSDWEEGESFLQDLVVDGDSLAAASEASRSAEGSFVG
ncbi:MAG: hypothetical protein M0Z42_04110 [Actinomycetota bacterium]|nr:hypothetical protein [Actinomycetota bacterium]